METRILKASIVVGFLLLAWLALPACECDDENQSSGNDDDSSVDVDDDTADDDTADDDSVDDDSVDDDSSDDDTTPTAQHDLDPFQSIIISDEGGVAIEMVAGGAPGHNRIGIAVEDDGTVAVAAVKGRSLIIYRVGKDGAVSNEIVAQYASGPALVADADGFLHLVYEDKRSEELIYANNRNGHWVFQSICSYPSSNPTVPADLELSVDSGGSAHVAFVDGTTGTTISYATNMSGQWIVELVDTAEDYVYPGVGLAVNEDGSIMLAYCLCTSTQYDYGVFTTRVDGEWERETLETNKYLMGSDVAKDTTGNPRVVYRKKDGDDNVLGYWTKEGSVWSQEDVSLDGGGFNNLHVVVDSDGQTMIVFENGDSNEIQMLLRSIAGIWSLETLLSPEDNEHTGYFDLDLNDEGMLLVGFYSWTHLEPSGSLNAGRLAFLSETDDGWDTTLVEEVRGAGKKPALAIDSRDRLHLGFSTDETTTYPQAWMAEGVLGGWHYEPIAVGRHISLVLDSNDATHVVFWDPESSRLVYASDETGEWTTVPVAVPEGLSYFSTTIALDEDERPHFVACGSTVNELGLGNGSLVIVSEPNGWELNQIEFGWMTSSCEVSMVMNGEAHLVRYTHQIVSDQGLLQYYYPHNGEWKTQLMAGGPNYVNEGSGPDLLVDDAGVEHLSYGQDNQVRVAEGSVWNWDREAAAGGEFYYPPDGYSAIALGADGSLYVAFQDTSDNNYVPNLVIAKRTGDDWVAKVFDRGPYYGDNDIDLAVDSAGYAHVVYTGDDAVWHAQISPEFW